jgi:hypothetical protein
MTAPELEALALRCEQAGGPDRELDAQIAPLRGLRVVDEGHPLGHCCYDARHQMVILPRFTSSIDAAMTLVPEGLGRGCFAMSRDSFGQTHCNVWTDAEFNWKVHASAATPALAITAAALRALARSPQP